MENQRDIYRRHIGDFSRYTRDFVSSVIDSISQRNSVASEYYKADFYLKDKKFKDMCCDKTAWEVDKEELEKHNIDIQEALDDTRIASRFMHVEVVL